MSRVLARARGTAPRMMLRRKAAEGTFAPHGDRCSAHGAAAGAISRPRVRHDFSRVPILAPGSAPTASREGGIDAAAVVDEAVRSPGRSLDGDVRADMEQRFGRDLGAVRVHTGERAARSARAVNALAYTVGPHVVFAAAQYRPHSPAGRRLLAHELVHVFQQEAGQHQDHNRTGISRSPRSRFARQTDDPPEREADRIAEHAMRPAAADKPGFAGPVAVSPAPGGMLQRQRRRRRQPQPQPAVACPTTVTFNFTQPAHVPHCGTTPLRAQTDVTGVTWSLRPDTAAVDPGSSIAANGTIALAASQPAGELLARATDANGCFFEAPFQIRSHPTAIASTQVLNAVGGTDYGAVFDHVFDSADGNVASLHNVGVGERFTNVPNPAAASHVVGPPLYPFGGTFTLNTSTLTDNATDNWFLTSAGELGGQHDTVDIAQANINVGRFIQSASNPAPTQALPAGFTLLQSLHWFCPQKPAGSRWTAFRTVAHTRTLRHLRGQLEFVTTVNGVEHVDAYAGPTAVFNLNASPASTPRSPSAAPGGTGAASAPRTVRIVADTLPASLSGQSLTFSISGAALGCTVAPDPADDHAAILTIGTTAGTVTVQAADSTNVNQARVSIVIT